MKKIHVGFLLSYDYDKLKKSIPPVYKSADRIFIAMDKELRTWSGEYFTLDPSFFEWLKDFDSENKIEIYEDDFYVPELKAIENDNREREMLSKKMGIGNWLVQVDSDEYFFNFESFVKDLRKYDKYLDNPEKKNIQIAAFLINLYKYSDDGILYVKAPTRGVMATNYPNYKVARNTRKRIVYTQNLLLHESIARTEEELLLKFENWGHNIDIKDKDAFMEKWRTTNKSNYEQREDFFYIEPEKWKHLDYAQGKTLEEIAGNMDLKAIMPSKTFIAGKNFGQWFKFLFK
ncbi:hypothetical protein ESY86_04510 [Subsaximicrobium wynnwilliamsii]|uniref:Glycosyltransferase family 2 protein n=1 Tax=Subsaximicrobium wynnwilliamsii TaxID=291179 RepID=A0A5C6ZLS4_9FLAO|nr:hypothetical protein [Subsaximicrobium wynnwilliamsii]TXD84964.1 hypothetical protein ESY87_04290 [Subsaximicrobium wynnwilliamsii]TXD90635.1 hypothetical protein ESY86_04510 [Subsaximicrobium wynnwilliamsii]TXE05109.1 hypothetical protein ESY88_02815 [Subsaximicrobium wynnwilliamsii]